MICKDCTKKDSCDKYKLLQDIKKVSDSSDFASEEYESLKDKINSGCEDFRLYNQPLVESASVMLKPIFSKLDNTDTKRLVQDFGFDTNEDIIKGFKVALSIIEKEIDNEHLVVLNDCDILKKVGISGVSDTDKTRETLSTILNRQIGKPLVRDGYCGFTDYECPVCNKDVTGKGYKYCPRCGQKFGED